LDMAVGIPSKCRWISRSCRHLARDAGCPIIGAKDPFTIRSSFGCWWQRGGGRRWGGEGGVDGEGSWGGGGDGGVRAWCSGGVVAYSHTLKLTHRHLLYA
jgi:hypothetical protein